MRNELYITEADRATLDALEALVARLAEQLAELRGAGLKPGTAVSSPHTTDTYRVIKDGTRFNLVNLDGWNLVFLEAMDHDEFVARLHQQGWELDRDS